MTDDLFGGATALRRKSAAKKAARAAPARRAAEYNASSIEVLEGLEPVRRRPGMYIGGTDANAMHHLFAEVIDNAMDEAVAGHATYIDVSLDEGGCLCVADNGRGMPVDPHPKFPGKSALEIIMTKLHAGGKFDSVSTKPRAACTASASPWSTRSRSAAKSRWCATKRSTARPLSAACRSLSSKSPARRPTGAAPACASAQTRRFLGRLQVRSGAALQDDARKGLSVRRRRDPLALRASLIDPMAKSPPRRFSTSPAV